MSIPIISSSTVRTIVTVLSTFLITGTGFYINDLKEQNRINGRLDLIVSSQENLSKQLGTDLTNKEIEITSVKSDLDVTEDKVASLDIAVAILNDKQRKYYGN